METYSIEQLVSDLKRIRSETTDERQILGRVRPLARQAALSKDAWVKESMYRADPQQGFGVHLLHEEADHTLAVLAVSWLPDRGTPPHNHGTWAVVTGVDGAEENTFFERVDDASRPGHAELRKIGAKQCDVGDVVAMTSSTIHAVWNNTEKVSVSLHIYGKHINFTGRSQFDLDAKTETPFIVTIERP